MRALPYIIRKEFQQIRRNRIMVLMMSILPVLQLIVLSYAADFEVKDLQLAVMDQDHSPDSRTLIRHFLASGYFQLQGYYDSESQALRRTEEDQADLILIIPREFGRSLENNLRPRVQILINAINSQKAGVAGGYCTRIFQSFNRDLAGPSFQGPGTRTGVPEIREAYWYNPELNYKLFMVPGILAVLVTMLTAFLSGVNIIRERELGTMEQINVSPISKVEFILGKLIPFWLIGMFLLGFGLLLAWLLFGVTVQGSVWTLFTFCGIYVIAILGIGMFISTITNTQQQSMFVTWFFLIIFILLSGLFTPVDSMPAWAKWFNTLNPIQYFVLVMRMVMLKSSGWKDLLPFFGIMTAFAVLTNLLAVLNYRKTSG